MKIISPSTEILTPISEGGLGELKAIERVARTCYKSEDYITEDGESAKKIVAMLVKSGHEAMLEHVSITVKFICNRAVTHEIVRHRLASYGQESQRYCNYTKGKFGSAITFIDPRGSMAIDSKVSAMTKDQKDDMFKLWEDAMRIAETQYNTLIAMGCTPQIARGVLPNSTKTEINMTANLREWRHFLRLRTSSAADPAMREVAIPLLHKMYDAIPIIFDDIYEALPKEEES